MIEWKDSISPYTNRVDNGRTMFLGKWKVANIGWDGVNRTDLKWIVYLHLPGLKDRLEQQYKTMEEAMERAEKAVQSWIEKSEIKSE